MAQKETESDTFRILLSTDNHLGFAEKDGIRGPDSFRTFEEILSLAKTQKVDFLFFGGDIFHDNRPSMRTLHETIRLLREYCLGDKPVEFEMLSDMATSFSNTAFKNVNYLDENINVGIPVFAIHGNHDDPNGPGGVSAIDILHAAGLVNLIGKNTSVERICLSPLLFRKGSTSLALYGLGAMREERVHRLFANNMVTFCRPTEGADDWFSICAVHQNRAHHGPTNYLPEQFLPDFLDLVIWGHEHECRVEPEWNSTQNFFVVQPGSSVVTALSQGEAQPKAVALLEVRGKEFKVTRIPLRTVRPFIFQDVVLEKEMMGGSSALGQSEEVESVCARIIEDSLTKAAADSSVEENLDEPVEKRCKNEAELEDASTSFQGRTWKTPSEPIVRLRIDLSGGYESFSSLRFGQRFIGRVANPKDLISFNHNRDKLAAAHARRALTSDLSNQPDTAPDTDDLYARKLGLDVIEVEKLIIQYLLTSGKPSDVMSKSSADQTNLDLFTALELNRSLRQFVDKDSRDAVQSLVVSILNSTVEHLRSRSSSEEYIVPNIISFRNSRISSDEGLDDVKDVLRPGGNLDPEVTISQSSISIEPRAPPDGHDDITCWAPNDRRAETVSTRNTASPKRRPYRQAPRSSRLLHSTIFSQDDDATAEVLSAIEDGDSPPGPSVASLGRMESGNSRASFDLSASRGQKRGRGRVSRARSGISKR
ncbi:unnamed protein product [Dicrocoelium dendriticum]|nr:unnamed protein product [Dicrocoelium dendriticum]